jgi:hypothetical protein
VVEVMVKFPLASVRGDTANPMLLMAIGTTTAIVTNGMKKRLVDTSISCSLKKFHALRQH